MLQEAHMNAKAQQRHDGNLDRQGMSKLLMRGRISPRKWIIEDMKTC